MTSDTLDLLPLTTLAQASGGEMKDLQLTSFLIYS